jgi:uncharacterized protein (TIGR01619 family)
MSENWNVYFTSIDEQVASVVFDHGIVEDAPITTLPCLIIFKLQMLQPREEDGLSSNVEAELLEQIEDAVSGQLINQLQAISVGRITSNGLRRIYYYAPQHDGSEAIIKQVMQAFPDYEFTVEGEDDPEWQLYLNILFPSPQELQCISNRKVLDQLEAAGDTLETPRVVEHWAYFPNAETRAAFITTIEQQGYVVTEIRDPESDDERVGDGLDAAVSFQRHDSVQWGDINQVTVMLNDLALDNQGYYDGWETTVILEADETE